MIFLLIFFSSVAHSAEPQNNRFQNLGVQLNPWAESQIQFWFRIFTEYSTHDAVIHDSVNLDRIYQKVQNDSKHVTLARNEVHNMLLDIYKTNPNGKTLDPAKLTDEQRVYFLLQEGDLNPQAYAFAADYSRIRSQAGQKDRLENAYSISKLYLHRMEEMFVEEKVPVELTRLPFVESGFEKKAQSSVGAVGIWQFMPKTAQKDLRVDRAIDERYDPLKSTRAAAKYLRSNYLHFKNWSLAIMAYNEGPGLVDKAVKRLKTSDPVQIVRLFKNGSFQFASRNYLFEFLAMLDVDAKHELFFKKEDATLPPFITVSFQKKEFIEDILAKYKLSQSLTQILNPHFREPIWKNQSPIPAHYPVRLTGITLEEFRAKQ